MTLVNTPLHRPRARSHRSATRARRRRGLPRRSGPADARRAGAVDPRLHPGPRPGAPRVRRHARGDLAAAGRGAPRAGCLRSARRAGRRVPAARAGDRRRRLLPARRAAAARRAGARAAQRRRARRARRPRALAPRLRAAGCGSPAARRPGWPRCRSTVDALVELGRYGDAAPGAAAAGGPEAQPLDLRAGVLPARAARRPRPGRRARSTLAAAAGGPAPENAAAIEVLRGDLALVRGRPAEARARVRRAR